MTEPLPIYCTGGCDACRDYARELGVPLIVPTPAALAAIPAHTPGALDVALRELELLHGLDVDFEAGVVRCNCGNFAGTTTYIEHLIGYLRASAYEAASPSEETR